MSTEKQVKLRIVGKMVFTTIDGVQYKASLETIEKDKLKANVEAYNKKPSEYWMKRIVKTFTDKEKITAKKIEKKKQDNKKKEVKREVVSKKELTKAEKQLAEILSQVSASNEVLEASMKRAEELKAEILASEERLKQLAETSKKTEATPVYGERRSGEY